VRGQFVGYRNERLWRRTRLETFCRGSAVYRFLALGGVPWYLRSGKCLAATVAEVLVELKPPPSTSSPIGAGQRAGELSAFFGSRPTRPSRWRRGSSAQARSSSRPALTLPARRPASNEQAPTKRLLADRHGRPGRVVSPAKSHRGGGLGPWSPDFDGPQPAYPTGPAPGTERGRRPDRAARKLAQSRTDAPSRAPVAGALRVPSPPFGHTRVHATAALRNCLAAR